MGTGLNLPMYSPSHVQSVTALDISPGMLAQVRRGASCTVSRGARQTVCHRRRRQLSTLSVRKLGALHWCQAVSCMCRRVAGRRALDSHCLSASDRVRPSLTSVCARAKCRAAFTCA